MTTTKKISILVFLLVIAVTVSGCSLKLNKPVAVEKNKKQEVATSTNRKNNIASSTVENKIASSTEEVDISGWKTYRNEEYKIEFQYPSNLTVKDWASETPNWELLLYVGKNKNIGGGVASLGIDKNIKKFDPQMIEWLSPPGKLKFEEVKIGKGNYKAHKETFISSIEDTVDSESYYIEYNNKLYQIEFYKVNDPDFNENDFNKLLRSFKFI